MNKYELTIGLMIIAIGSFIAGVAIVAIQLEKVKKQRDEAIKRVKELESYG